LTTVLVVLVERNAAGFKDARTLEVAGFDFEHVETAVVVGVSHLPIE